MLADASLFTNFGMMTSVKYLGSKPFLNLTVEEYLWGYDDPMVDMANTFVSSWIPFAKLGLLDRVRMGEISELRSCQQPLCAKWPSALSEPHPNHHQSEHWICCWLRYSPKEYLSLEPTFILREELTE